MKWAYFIVITYAPALLWSIFMLPVLFKYPRIHKAWRKTLLAGFALSAAPYPLAYYACRKSGWACPAITGSVMDFIVMSGTVLIGIVIAGVWNKGFDHLLHKKEQRESK